METPGFTPDTSLDEVLGVFHPSDRPRRPLTTAEVADRLDCPDTAATDQLEALVDRGDLHSRRVDAPTRVWWPADDDETGASTTSVQSEQFQSFIDAVEDYAIFLLGPDGHVRSWNDGAERIKGYREEDIVGEHFSTFYTSEDEADAVPEENLAAATERGRVEDEGWRVRADGSEFWANVVITAIRDDDGTLQGFTKVTRDLTGQREYEQRLRRERDLSEQVLETVPVSITVLTPEGEFLRASSRALERLGIAENDLDQVAASSWDLYDEAGEPIPSSETPWVTAAEAGEPVHDFRCQVELPAVGRRWLSVDAAPVDVDEETDDRVVLSVDDVTEQVDRERTLRRERNQTVELLRTAPVALAVQDASGETMLANDRAQEVLGLSEQELIEEPEEFEDWNIYDADGERLGSDETPSARVVATGEPVFDEEVAIEKPSSDRLWLSINASPIFDADGTLERVVTAGEDITELKRREYRLERRTSELEAELSEVLGRVSDAFYAMDDEWRFTLVNDRAEELLQHPREELVGERPWDVFPEARETAIWDRFHEAMDTQNPVSFEYEYGELDIWLEITAYPSATGLSVYFQDVTQRREREQELQRYERVVETVWDGITVLDSDDRFVMVNEAFCDITGYDREEVIGEHATLILDESTYGQAGELHDEVVEGASDIATLEYDLQTADGGTIPVEARFGPVEYTDGVAGGAGVIRDVSERRARERAVEESERRHRTLVEHFPDGAVAMFDEDLRYTAVGGQLLDQVGLNPEDRIGKHLSEAYPEDIVEEYGRYFQAVFESEANAFESEIHDRYLYNQTLPVRNAEDEVIAGMLVAQDITDRIENRNRLEETVEKLEASNERLEEFAYIASHDLQEPLRMVSSYLQLLDDRYRAELREEAREFIDFAVDSAERMRAMVEGLLSYSRLDTEAEPLEPTEPADVVHNVLDGLQVQIDESGAEVSVGELPTVAADENQLEQVFQNLISNAIKYRGDDPPRVEVTAERRDGSCRFRVADNGIGIDPAYTDQIFEVFERLHSSKDYPGTGIGLALCRKVVERHGGRLWVESEPGGGSTFYFTIPLAGPPAG